MVQQPLVFTSKPKTSHIPDLPFELDDREYVAHAPKKAAWGMLVHGMSNPGRDGFQAALTFLDACLDLPDQMFLEQRLRDRDDDLDLDDLLEVVDALLTAWEPHLGDEFAELTGENRATRRAARRRTPTPAANGTRQGARRTQAAKK